jgi:hypothetical protein
MACLVHCDWSTALAARKRGVGRPVAIHISGKVIGITDGDTLTVFVNREPVKVRLAEVAAVFIIDPGLIGHEVSRRIAMRAHYCLLALALLLGCGTPTAMTTWPYATWYARDGASSLGGFERAHRSCLEELDITDPGGVAHDSPPEDGFIRCMNADGWCSNAYHCNKPGAS